MRGTGERQAGIKLSDIEIKHRERYRYAQKFCRDKKVLDAACGCGYGAYILSQSAKSVLGVDYSKEAVEFAQKFWSKKNIQYQQFDLNQDLTLLGKFDIIVSLETIEHLDVPILETCEKFYQLLSSGGLFILSHPEKEASPDQKSRKKDKEQKNHLVASFTMKGLKWCKNMIKRLLGNKQRQATYHKHFNIDGKKLKGQLVNMGFRVKDEWYQLPRFYYYYHLLVLEKE